MFQADNSVKSSLTIHSVHLSDSGVYRCTSESASEAKVAVIVTSGKDEHAAKGGGNATCIKSSPPCANSYAVLHFCIPAQIRRIQTRSA